MYKSSSNKKIQYFWHKSHTLLITNESSAVKTIENYMWIVLYMNFAWTSSRLTFKWGKRVLSYLNGYTQNPWNTFSIHSELRHEGVNRLLFYIKCKSKLSLEIFWKLISNIKFIFMVCLWQNQFPFQAFESSFSQGL